MITIRRIGVYALPMVWRAIVGFAVLPLTTYRLDVADFGLFALVTSLSSFGAGASGLGSMYALSRDLIRLDLEDQRNLVSTLLWLGMAVGVAFAAAVLAGWPALLRLVPELSGAPPMVIVILPMLILLGVPWNHASAVILVTGRAGDFAVINVLESIGSIITTLVALYIYNMGVESLFLGALAGAAINAIASLVSIRKYLRFRYSARWMAESFHVGGLAMVCSLVERGKATVEIYALANYVNIGSLGIYRHSQQYMNLAKSGANAISFAAWPVALDEARTPEKGFPKLAQVWPSAQLGLALAGVAMATFGENAIGLLTHGKFTRAYIFATLWIIFVMFENASKAAVAIIYVFNLGIASQRIALLASVLAVTLMVPSVYWFGAYGAIFANFVSATVYRGLIVAAARRAAPVPFQDGTLFFAMVVVLVTLVLNVATESNLLWRGAMLIVSTSILVIFCRSARQSTFLALKAMFA